MRIKLDITATIEHYELHGTTVHEVFSAGSVREIDVSDSQKKLLMEKIAELSHWFESGMNLC